MFGWSLDLSCAFPNILGEGEERALLEGYWRKGFEFRTSGLLGNDFRGADPGIGDDLGLGAAGGVLGGWLFAAPMRVADDALLRRSCSEDIFVELVVGDGRLLSAAGALWTGTDRLAPFVRRLPIWLVVEGLCLGCRDGGSRGSGRDGRSGCG